MSTFPASPSQRCPRPSFRPCSLLGMALLLPNLVWAQILPENAAREQRRLEERVDAIRQQQEQGFNYRRAAPPASDARRLPEQEKPCFAIDKVTLSGDDGHQFTWLLSAAAGTQGDDAPQGKCLGQQGINLLLDRMQNALVAEGYITTRVSVAAQDLRRRELQITVTPGRIRAIRLDESVQSSIRLWAAIPVAPGDLLNLRDIEQGLENMRGLPSADAEIKIVPGEQPGESDLVVVHRQASSWRGTLSADDSGTKATGKYQGSATVALDNAAHLNDLLYLTLNHDITGKGGRGTDGGIVHYSAPYGYWNLGATYDWGSTRQTIAGAFQNYTYSSKTANAEVKLTRVLHRDATSKTALTLAAFRRSARNYIDDTEVEVQRRRTGGWSSSIQHRRNIGAAVLDASLGYRRGTGAFDALTAPEELFFEGTSHFKITTLDLTYATPFNIGTTAMRYQLNLRGQKEDTRLAAPERFSIGGRATVRGFDGETILSAENGWLLRNELAVSAPLGMEAYWGVDYGEVGGPTADLLIGKRLAGTALGVRGGYRQLRYDLFVGAPLHKPDGFVTADVTGGFSISLAF